MENNKFGIYIVFIVIAVYFSQGWLYERGSVLSQTMLLLWIVLDVFYLLKTIIYHKIISLEWVIIIFMIIIFWSWIYGDKMVISYRGWHVSTLGDMKNIIAFMLSYFPFNYFIKYREVLEGNLRMFFWMMLIVSVGTYVANGRLLLEESSADSVTNNYAYCFAMMIPFLGFFFDKRIKYILLIVFLYFIMTGAKRGAVVIFFIESVFLFYFSMYNMTRKKRIQGLLGIFIGFVIFVVIVVILYNSNDYLQDRLDMMLEGDDSGRSYIREQLISEFYSSNGVQLLFGRGMDQTINICGQYAHNDWIQLLIDTGILGTGIYLLLFIQFFHFYFSNKKKMEAKFKFLYISAVTCWLMKSFYSMGYNDIYTYIVFPPIVYVYTIMQNTKDNYAVN